MHSLDGDDDDGGGCGDAGATPTRPHPSAAPSITEASRGESCTGRGSQGGAASDHDAPSGASAPPGAMAATAASVARRARAVVFRPAWQPPPRASGAAAPGAPQQRECGGREAPLGPLSLAGARPEAVASRLWAAAEVSGLNHAASAPPAGQSIDQPPPGRTSAALHQFR